MTLQLEFQPVAYKWQKSYINMTSERRV